MEQVKDILKDIKSTLTQTSQSQKDEVRVMRAMINDRDYEVDVYGKTGKEGTYNPAKSLRGMVASVVASTTKVPQVEAEKLVGDYEFKKADAAVMVDVSKEFVNTFIQSGRKLSFGGREKSNIAISLKQVDEHMASYPKQVGVKDDGTPSYGKGEALVKAHETIKVHPSCPSWV